MVVKMVRFGVLFVMVMLVVAGAMWPSSRDHQNRHEVIVKDPRGSVVIEFEKQHKGNAKILISQHGDSGVGGGGSGGGGGGSGSGDHGRRWWWVVEDGEELFCKLFNKLMGVFNRSKNVVLGKAHELEELAKETLDEAAEKARVGKLSKKLSDGVKSVGETARSVAGDELAGKISDGVSSVGEKAKEVAGTAKSAVGEALGGRIGGTLKDYVDKMENWDVVDSPKRIGEDIERNVSRKVEEGAEEVKETLEDVKETSLNELFRRSKRLVRDVYLMFFSLERIKEVVSWWHLFGFSIAYGMGVWFTFVSRYLLSKCLPKQKLEVVVSKMHMVYFRAMTYCVGGSLIGYMVSQGRKGIVVWNKMEMFQGFNLFSAFLMILINLIFLEPQATKLILERKKIKEERKTVGEKEGGWNEKLKKLNVYSSTLNVSTLVVLTWHLAYIGQLLQTRDD